MKLKREGNPVWVDRDCASLLSDVLFEEDYKADGAVERTEAHVHALAAIVGRMLDAGGPAGFRPRRGGAKVLRQQVWLPQASHRRADCGRAVQAANLGATARDGRTACDLLLHHPCGPDRCARPVRRDRRSRPGPADPPSASAPVSL